MLDGRYKGGRAGGYDFRILDRNGGAGWDLACRLTRRRNAFNRGRLSASQVKAGRENPHP